MQDFMIFFQSNLVLSLVWVGLVIAIIMSVIKSANAAYKEVTVNELTQLVNRENGIVVDIRSKDEYKKGHITDSVHVMPADIKEGKLEALENQKAAPMIVVCKTGQTAQASANELAKAGFEKVYLLKNGMISWKEANLPLVRSNKKK
ncbi:rhodanese-like domain-containing protein [Vibrio sp.]|nr:rhodanese-like domain-containing protein [Vibrio sp.]